MPARLLEGKVIAKELQESLIARIAAIRAKGMETPGLLVLQANRHPSSDWYIGQQKKLAEKLGVKFQYQGPDVLSSEEKLIAALKKAQDKDSGVHGIFVAQPFFDQGTYSADKILSALDPQKDVEGVGPIGLGLIVLRKGRLIPPTAYAALQLIESVPETLPGKRAVVIGQSAIVGRPLQLLLCERKVTTTVCHTGTTREDLEAIVRESDIVVACVGKPGLVKGGWIKEGAIVIDVGTTEVAGTLKGDVDFEPASARAAWITPVPGGVGPLTVTMLMKNLLLAYDWQKEI